MKLGRIIISLLTLLTVLAMLFSCRIGGDDGAKYTTLAAVDEWFTFRIDYYYASAREDVRIKYYVNDELVLCSNNYPRSNLKYDHDSNAETADVYYEAPETLDRAFRLRTNSSFTNATIQIDNYTFSKIVKECADDALTYTTQDP